MNKSWLNAALEAAMSPNVNVDHGDEPVVAFYLPEDDDQIQTVLSSNGYRSVVWRRAAGMEASQQILESIKQQVLEEHGLVEEPAVNVAVVKLDHAADWANDLETVHALQPLDGVVLVEGERPESDVLDALESQGVQVWSSVEHMQLALRELLAYR